VDIINKILFHIIKYNIMNRPKRNIDNNGIEQVSVFQPTSIINTAPCTITNPIVQEYRNTFFQKVETNNIPNNITHTEECSKKLGRRIVKSEKVEQNTACNNILNNSTNHQTEMSNKYTLALSKNSSPTSSKVFDEKEKTEVVAPTIVEKKEEPIKEIVPTPKIENEPSTPVVSEDTTNVINYNSIILDLGILGKLEIGYKLRILENSIVIDDRYLQSIQRALTGDDRTSTIEYINKLIASSEILKNKLILDIKKETVNNNSSVINRNLNFQLTELIEKLKCAEKGLENLKKTYDYDINIGVIFDNYIKQVNKIWSDANLEIHISN